MIKVLLSFVGEQDPISAKTMEEGAIVTLYRQIKPDYVFLLPTADSLRSMPVNTKLKRSMEDNARETKGWIINEIDANANIFIRPIEVIPVDYNEIIGKARAKVEEIKKEFSDCEVEFHLNTSSGTPQMKGVWLYLSTTGFFRLARLWQVFDPNYIKEGKSRIKEINADFLLEEGSIARAKRLLEDLLFKAAADELKRLADISIFSHRKEKAMLLYEICIAYHQWDLINYKEAYQKLNSIFCRVKNALDISDLVMLLERQVTVLKKLARESEKETRENLMDLFYNSTREYAKRNYTDSLARFWRLYEGLLYWYIRKTYGLEPVELNKSPNKVSWKKLYEYANDSMNRFFVTQKLAGVKNSEIVLEHVFNDKLFQGMREITLLMDRGISEQKMKLTDALTELREKRNNSIVAHGMKPVSEAVAAKGLDVIGELFEHFGLCTKEELKSYPFKPEDMKILIDVLQKGFL